MTSLVFKSRDQSVVVTPPFQSRGSPNQKEWKVENTSDTNRHASSGCLVVLRHIVWEPLGSGGCNFQIGVHSCCQSDRGRPSSLSFDRPSASDQEVSIHGGSKPLRPLPSHSSRECFLR
eukprot:6459201-Amphidinium_carterae.1